MDDDVNELRMRDPFAALAAALSETAGQLAWDPSIRPSQSGIDGELTLLDELCQREVRASELHLWRNSHCLVVPRSFAFRERFAEAKGICPLPVAVRRSGGRAVIVGPHVANLSLYTIKYREDTLEISELFADLARVLFPALAMFGITASYKRVAGAYCDGKYDIAVGGRKLGGTAGLTRAVRQMRAGIVHAAISLRDQAGDLSVVADFERNLGFDYNYRRGAMTSFSQEIASTASHIAA